MLTFFRSKPKLRDLIPNNYVDIHSHLLPGIDDGAMTFEETLQHTKSLLDIGVSQFITTPHVMQTIWENSSAQINAKVNTTVIELEKNQVTIPFRAAAEYMLDDSFIKLFKSEKLLTLKDNYVLVEMSYINPPIQLYTVLFDLQVAGYIPVLAHPERYIFYHNNFDEYLKLKRIGCLFQLNLLSVAGYYGDAINKISEKLLQKGMYDFVGTDVHHNNHIAAFEQKVKFKDLAPLKEVITNNQFFRFEI